MSGTVKLLVAIFAVLAASGAGTAFYYSEQSRQRDYQLEHSRSDLKAARNEADRLRAEITRLREQAAALDSQLGLAKTRSTVSETKSSLLTRDLHSTREELTARQAREVALLSEIESLRQQRTAAAGETQVTSAGAVDRAEALAAYSRRIVALEAQLTELLARALAELPPASSEREPAGPAPSTTFQVLRVGARDAFVVLDYGGDHGALRGQPATLRRGTSEVARVLISDVRPRLSIAHVLDPTRKGQLQPGDIVLFPD